MSIPAADPFGEAAQYKYGQPTDPLAAIQAEIRSADAAQLRAIEAKLVSILQSSASTPDAKSWACRTLRFAGSEQCVAAVAALLGNPALSADAQFALRGIISPKVDAALRQALPTAGGLAKAGIIQTLGARADRNSVSAIAPLVGDPERVIAEAALYALGNIGGSQALNALEKAQVPDTLAANRDQALFACVREMLRAGKSSEALTACRRLYEASKQPPVQAGALRALVLADPAAGRLTLAAALERAKEPALRAAAARCLADCHDETLVGTILKKFEAWPEDTKVMVLGLLTSRSALPTVRGAAASGSDGVRAAAFSALGTIGDASDLRQLLSAAAVPGSGQQPARASLLTLRGKGVSEGLVTAMKTGPPALRGEAIRAVAGRGQTNAGPVLLALAKDPEPAVRAEAQRVLGQVAGPADLPVMTQMLVQAATDQDREAVERALSGVIGRIDDKDAAAAALKGALAGSSVEVRCALLRVLAHAPCRVSLETLRAATTAAEPVVKDVAIRSMADWPDTAAMADLLALARGAQDANHRALALRGFIRLAAVPNQRPSEQTTDLLGQGLALATRPEEKRAVLAALVEVQHVSALTIAESCLGDPAIETEAANAVVRLARKVQATNPDAAAGAVRKILETCKTPAARQLAEGAGIVLADMINIAPQGTATSPDGLEKDGQAGGDQAAIDGDPATYWDEQDGAKLYRLVVTFKEPKPIAAISISGYAQHNFAPRDFEILCDGKTIKKIENAQYTDNLLILPLPETTGQSLELKITGYYGGSPAIRELGIYQRRVAKAAQFSVLVFSKTLGFRHSNIPLGVTALRQLGAEHEFAVEATEDSGVFTRANLAKYKAVVFLSVTGDVLDNEQENALKEFVLNGGGFVGIHGALYGPSACEDKWAWYGELCCAAFKNHSAVVPGQVNVEDMKNPSTAGLPARWQRTDEWYNYSQSPRGCAHVLATLDESTYQGGTMGPDHPISWCRQMGQGRMWYTAMGHTEESFREPLFLKHLAGGIKLAAGVQPADLTPNPKPAHD